MLSDSVITRFLAYLEVGTRSKCWVWKGSLAVRGGYGQLNNKGRLLKAHRIAFELAFGKIPKGAHICHKCNNPPCCNPGHLYAGDNLSNTRDKIKAGTQFKIPPQAGEKNYQTKFKAADIKAIRSSSESGASLARKFKVSKASISAIRRFKTWKSI